MGFNSGFKGLKLILTLKFQSFT